MAYPLDKSSQPHIPRPGSLIDGNMFPQAISGFQPPQVYAKLLKSSYFLLLTMSASRRHKAICESGNLDPDACS